MAVSKDAAQQTVAVGALSVRGGRSAAPRGGAKRLVLGVLVRILLAVVELLLERLGLFLVRKGQCS
jgi:hypothetical protein